MDGKARQFSPLKFLLYLVFVLFNLLVQCILSLLKVFKMPTGIHVSFELFSFNEVIIVCIVYYVVAFFHRCCY